MAIYELRTYTAVVGKMATILDLYKNEGWPALSKHPAKLVGYFTGDVGAMHQLIHLWKFDDDADRRAHWTRLFAFAPFIEGFAAKFRPLVQTQEVKLLTAAPWGPHP